jgi:hypothetical protein
VSQSWCGTHDFKDAQLGKVILYDVYDLAPPVESHLG